MQQWFYLTFTEPEKSVLQGKTTAVLLYYQMRAIESVYIGNIYQTGGILFGQYCRDCAGGRKSGKPVQADV